MSKIIVPEYYFIETWKDGEAQPPEKYFTLDDCFERIQELVNKSADYCVYKAVCILDAS